MKWIAHRVPGQGASGAAGSTPSLVVALLTVVLSLQTSPIEGQNPVPPPAQEQPAPIDNAEVVRILRASGLSRAEVRARLLQRGENPGLTERYFDAVELGAAVPAGGPTLAVLRALDALGLARAEPEAEEEGVTVLATDPEGRTPERLEVFGRSLFDRGGGEFQPLSAGPVDPDYRLGPGDQLQLVLTGDVETAHALEVSREGYILIPEVGQLLVNGLTMRELEDRLYSRLGSVYSGVRRGTGATTQFHASVGRIRTNQVFIIGEVERPGAYQISAVATVFNALYQAGGPSANGSFRRVEVRRAGRVIQAIDLYDYLLRGDSQDDIRLEQGDIVFVPVVGPQVGIQGAVRRPAIYELAGGDALQTLLGYAGRLEAEASVRRVQIDRILPPAERRPGVERVLVDVDVERLLRRDGAAIELQDGDLVQVFTVSTERRNRVTISGTVERPGIYEWRPGTTLWDVIDRAEGLAPSAYTPRAHIYRLNPLNGTRQLVRTALLADAAGSPLQDVPLTDQDEVVIYSRAELRNPETITIQGYVKNPGEYALAEGMTLLDLVLAAGGFTPGADMLEADVARKPSALARTDTTAHVLHVSLRDDGSDGGAIPRLASGNGRGDVPDWVPAADEFRLENGDVISVRKAEGFEKLRAVAISGQVLTPGAYVLRERSERLLDVLQRAGGLTPQADASGLRVVRAGNLVGTDLARAVREPQSRFNLVLMPGDSVHLPEFDPTVLVRGAVGFESRVLFRPGADLNYYISQAGGYTDVADKKRVSVTYANGERAITERHLGFIRRTPALQPGSTIVVPEQPLAERDGFDIDRLLSRALSLASMTITLLLAAERL